MNMLEEFKQQTIKVVNIEFNAFSFIQAMSRELEVISDVTTEEEEHKITCKSGKNYCIILLQKRDTGYVAYIRALNEQYDLGLPKSFTLENKTMHEIAQIFTYTIIDTFTKDLTLKLKS